MIARAWVRLIARVVPGSRRGGWLREWEAELAVPDRSMLRLLAWATEDALREAWGDGSVLGLARATKSAARGLRRSPGYAAAVTATLALGIGATTVVYSVVRSYVLAPLPILEPDRVLLLRWAVDGSGSFTSAPNFLDVERGTTSFASIDAAQLWPATLTGSEAPIRVARTKVTAGFFETVGVRLVLGRGFVPAEEEPASSTSVILSHEAWLEHFGGAPDVLGRSVRIDGVAHTVVGVTAPEVRVPPFTARVWTPLAFEEDALQARGRNNILMVGRLQDGTSTAEAQREADVVSARLAAEHPRMNEGRGIVLQELQRAALGSMSRTLWVLLAAAGLVLAIACVNVSSLVVARGLSRQRELSVRVALGASRSRLAAELLGETLLLSAVGGAAGIAVARGLTGAVQAMIPTSLASLGEIRVDVSVLATCSAIALASGILAGLFPALRLSRAATASGGAGVAGALRDRGATGRVSSTLVAAQFALTTLLLVGAGLLGRTLSRLYDVDLGIRTEALSSFTLSFPASEYGTPERMVDAVRSVAERLAAMPGVVEAAAVSHVPLGGRGLTSSVIYEGGPQIHGVDTPSMSVRVATPGFFQVVGLRLLRGRDLSTEDDEGAERAAVVNEAAARLLWPGEEALGRWLSFDDEEDRPIRRRVVGILPDVREAGPGTDAAPTVYIPPEQTGDVWRWFGRTVAFVARTRDADPLAMGTARAVVGAVDPDLPVIQLRTLDAALDAAVATPRFQGTLFGLFAAAGLLLAVVGLHGVTSFDVRRRWRELGVRMALGAGRGRVLSEVLARALRTAAVGSAVGFVAALVGARILSAMVWGVGARDPVTYAAVAGLLVVVAAVAAALPADRASRADPVESLHAE